MIKKIITLLMVVLLMLGLNTSIFNYHKAYADDEDDCDKACIIKRTQERMNELMEQMNKAKEDKKNFLALASEFTNEINELEEQINVLLPQIEELQISIDELERDIEYNQQLVDELEERVLTRMAEAQGTMHFNPYLDFLLGANGFSDMLRRMYGIEAINSKEEADRNELADIIKTLTAQKEELALAKEELDIKRIDLQAKQQEAEMKKQYYVEAARQADLDVDYYRNQYDEQLKIQIDLELNLDDLIALGSQTYFSSPVPGSSLSAGFPYYPTSFGGGVHLGVDYAAKIETSLKAPANGIIVISDDNCNTYGYLGNSCGGAGGGVSYGGNQLYMICSVDGNVYALTFSHLYAGSLVSKGVVIQGQEIAKVGSSGNSTGPHCHIEMFYLGEGENEDLQIYINRLKNGYYNLSFNCGWGSVGLQHICPNGVPCRLNGANYLPH